MAFCTVPLLLENWCWPQSLLRSQVLLGGCEPSKLLGSESLSPWSTLYLLLPYSELLRSDLLLNGGLESVGGAVSNLLPLELPLLLELLLELTLKELGLLLWGLGLEPCGLLLGLGTETLDATVAETITGGKSAEFLCWLYSGKTCKNL